MSERNIRPLQVQQYINGLGHQIAGRDIINISDIIQPDPNNPNVTECRVCHWHNLSRGADTCPECGHNYLVERLAKQEQERVERVNLVHSLMMWAAVSLIGGIEISNRLQLDLAQGLGLMVLAIFFGYVAWIWAKSRIQVARFSRQ